MIRTATPADLPAVVEGYGWLFAPPGSRPADWDESVALTRLQHVLATGTVLVTEELTGFCTVLLDIVSVRFGQRAWVEDLAVDPAHRSEGLGKQLLDAAKEWARQQGASHLELDSGDARLDAHRFYEREGAVTSRCFGWAL